MAATTTTEGTATMTTTRTVYRQTDPDTLVNNADPNDRLEVDRTEHTYMGDPVLYVGDRRFILDCGESMDFVEYLPVAVGDWVLCVETLPLASGPLQVRRGHTYAVQQVADDGDTYCVRVPHPTDTGFAPRQYVPAVVFRKAR